MAPVRDGFDDKMDRSLCVFASRLRSPGFRGRRSMHSPVFLFFFLLRWLDPVPLTRLCAVVFLLRPPCPPNDTWSSRTRMQGKWRFNQDALMSGSPFLSPCWPPCVFHFRCIDFLFLVFWFHPPSTSPERGQPPQGYFRRVSQPFQFLVA